MEQSFNFRADPWQNGQWGCSISPWLIDFHVILETNYLLESHEILKRTFVKNGCINPYHWTKSILMIILEDWIIYFQILLVFWYLCSFMPWNTFTFMLNSCYLIWTTTKHVFYIDIASTYLINTNEWTRLSFCDN